LSNLLSSSDERTPSLCISSIWRSICALSQADLLPAAAVERLGRLDLEHDRNAAGVDDRARLERIGDDLEEAPCPGRPACAST
jgi:hypothetical protein